MRGEPAGRAAVIGIPVEVVYTKSRPCGRSSLVTAAVMASSSAWWSTMTAVTSVKYAEP